jgi:hypothetical protein
MGHAHGHDHGPSDHGQGHGHAPAPGGSHEIPAAPAARHITPAPEDFATRPAASRLLWPVFWAVVAVLSVLAVRGAGWHEPAHHGTEPHPAPHGDR